MLVPSVSYWRWDGHQKWVEIIFFNFHLFIFFLSQLFSLWTSTIYIYRDNSKCCINLNQDKVIFNVLVVPVGESDEAETGDVDVVVPAVPRVGAGQAGVLPPH